MLYVLYASVCMSYRASIRCACYPTDKRKTTTGSSKACRLPSPSYTLKNITHEVIYMNIAKNIDIFFTIFNYTEQKYRSQGHTEEDRKIYIYVVILQVKMVDYGVMSECPCT